MRGDEPRKPEQGGQLVPASHIKAATATEVLRSVREHIARHKPREAFVLLHQSMPRFPNNPYIVSYFGYLQAIVDRRYLSGVETCKSALAMLRKHALSGNEVHYGVVYLNLGKTYIAARKKRDAYETFRQGLKQEPRNRELLKELHAMGKRKRTVLPFLKRSNPINKYLGLILHSLSNRK
jgi:hypothetical protein